MPDRLTRLRQIPSESESLTRLIDFLDVALGAGPERGEKVALAAIRRARDIAVELRQNAAEGLHRNPALVIMNPPLRSRRLGYGPGKFLWGGIMSHNVLELRYVHEKDGQAYKHPFESGTVEMWAIERAGRRDILLSGGDGQPLWEDM